MMRTRVLSRLAAAVFVVGLFGAGCSDADGEPTPTAEPTVTESAGESPSSPEPTTPAPGPTPWPEPTRPAAMDRDDIEGAKAAAEYFLALYPYVYVTGDLAPWQELSHPECQFCAGVISNVEDLHASGGYADGPAIEFVDRSAEAPTDNYQYFTVLIEAIEHPSSRYDSEGGVVVSQPGGIIDAEMALRHTGDKWLVRGAVVTPREEGVQ